MNERPPSAALAGAPARCSACLEALPTTANFCPNCGTEVRGARDERRIVTVLFADLVGFTGLAERRDPEQVKRFVDSCFEVLVDDIERYGGRVDKILGDGVLALFGAPISHEDDAERAVRCALQMHQSLAAVVEAAPVTGAPEDGQLMRIGVCTGEVLVGSVAGGDYTAMGDVVNTAARLQTAAPPGRVLVGDSTKSLTDTAIAYDAAGVVTPKGRAQPETTWLAVRPIAPPGTRHRLSDTPLVGRRLELQAVAAAQALSAGRGRGSLVTVAAEAGLGKTRFLREVGRRFERETGGRVFHSGCVPYGEANPWWPVAVVVDQALGLAAARRGLPAEVAATIEERVSVLDPSGEPGSLAPIVEMALHVLGLPSAIDRFGTVPVLSAIHQPFGRLLQLLAAARPTAITLDDLHWASPNVIGLLDYVADLLPQLSIALIVAQRPHGDTGWWPDERVTNLAFELQPLGTDETRRMILSLLGPDTPDELLTTIHERSGGNPLFVHEIAALARTGATLPVLPDTLRTIIGARLDLLPRDERNIVDHAATLGTSGTLTDLRALGARLEQPVSEGAMAHLGDRGLLATGDGRWRFLSDSVREAAYATMSKTSRAQRHATAADVLSSSDHPPLDDLAYHTAAAAQLVGELGSVQGVSPQIVDDAVRLLVDAANRAVGRGSFQVAISQAGRGLDLLPAHPSLAQIRSDLLLIRAASHLELRQYKAAWADVDEVLGTCSPERDAPRRGEALRLLGGLHHAMGAQDLARQSLDEAASLARSAGRDDLLARTLRAQGYIELFNGSLVDADRYLAQADETYSRLGDTAGRAWIEQHRALAAFLRGHLDDASRRLSVAAETMTRLGDQNGVGWANGMAAFVALYRTDFDRADELAAAVAERAAERGDEWATAMMRTLRAQVSLWRGQLRSSLDEAQASRTTFRRIGDALGLTQALSALVRVQVALGLFDDAQRTGAEILAITDRSPLGSVPLVAIAGAAMHRGMPHHALRLTAIAEEAMDESRIDNPGIPVIRAVGHAQLGELDDAARVLASVEVSGREAPFARSVEALLHAAGHRPAQALDAAATVRANPGASYFDMAFADLAAVSALAQSGDIRAAKAKATATISWLAEIGDVVAADLFALFVRRLDGETLDGSVESPAIGWSAFLRCLPAGPG